MVDAVFSGDLFQVHLASVWNIHGTRSEYVRNAFHVCSEQSRVQAVLGGGVRLEQEYRISLQNQENGGWEGEPGRTFVLFLPVVAVACR